MARLSQPIEVRGGVILPLYGERRGYLASRIGEAAQSFHLTKEGAEAYLLKTDPATRMSYKDYQRLPVRLKRRIYKRTRTKKAEAHRMARVIVKKRAAQAEAPAEKRGRGRPPKAAKAAKAKVAAKKAPASERVKYVDDEKLRAKVAAFVEKGMGLNEIDEALDLTSGTSYRINIANVVEDTPKLKIKFSDEEELVEAVAEAREEAGDYSSWYWLAGRTGVSVPTLKKIMQEAGTDTSAKVAEARAAAKAEEDDDEEPAPKAKKANKRGVKVTSKAKKVVGARRGRPPKAATGDPS